MRLRFVLPAGPGRSIAFRASGLLLALAAVNVLVWVWAFEEFGHQPALMGTALLAWTFGLRHAVDADHIAAIDNTTRKLMARGGKPLCTGLFFAAGHSLVVMALTLAVALAASAVTASVQPVREIAGVIGTLVSVLFLFAIAFVNLVLLVSVVRSFRAVRQGAAFADNDLDALLSGRGLLARLFRPVFRLVTQSWHMLPVGALFGIGFDTATEVALMGISATQAQHGSPLPVILVFPALFAAGMMLVDTADGILMLGAYGWASIKPVRKLWYNMTITGVSAAVAIAVGGLEALNLAGDELGLSSGSGFFGTIAAINDNFGTLGYIIIGIFAASWLASVLVYRFKGYDRLEPETPG